MSVRWQADHDDPTSVDDLFVKNATSVRLERMGDGFCWFAFEVDGVWYNIDLHVTAKGRRKIIAFNRGELPPAEKKP